MMARTQITLDPELWRRARKRASQLGISLAGYVRQLLAKDLHEPETDVDPNHPSGERVQLVKDRAGTSLTSRAADLAYKAGIEKAGQRQRYRRLRKAADPGRLGTRQRALAMD